MRSITRIQDSPGKGIHEICSEIREMVEDNGVKVVFIDGFGLIRNKECRMSRSLWLAEVFKELKLLAMDLGISIICPWNLNRIDSANMGPTFGDIEYSEMIAGYSDIVLLIDNPAMRVAIKEDDVVMADIRKVIVSKNNNSSTGGFTMRLNSETGQFEEVGP